jgi:calcium-dependent protein kinase
VNRVGSANEDLHFPRLQLAIFRSLKNMKALNNSRFVRARQTRPWTRKLASSSGSLNNIFDPSSSHWTQLDSKYILGDVIGKGGNGIVRIIQPKESDERFACKSIIKKRLIPGGSRPLSDEAAKKTDEERLAKIRREVEVMQRLSGALNVVELIDVLEDNDYVHLVMELCTGGELSDRIRDRHYSERTVSSYLRAVLRTLSIMHSRSILHLDVKPGNFLLKNETETSPLKAIDFGLAVPFESLPLTTSGLEGTPWYQSPELLETSSATPAADIWAVGIMAHQLLVGSFPFDDKKNKKEPSLSAIWRSILTDHLDFTGSRWQAISQEGRDFVTVLLQRDPKKRPTAKEALDHPFLVGCVEDRNKGPLLDRSVVAGIQRFAMASALKRSVLQLMAAELLGKAKVNYAARVVEQLSLDGEDEVMDAEQFEQRLERIGYHMEAGETDRLVEKVGGGKIDSSMVAAAVIDWRDIQKNRPEEWKRLVASAFQRVDESKSGVINADDVAHLLGSKFSEEDVQDELSLALTEASLQLRGGGVPGAHLDNMDLDAFGQMLMVDSLSSLDQYESRYESLKVSKGE